MTVRLKFLDKAVKTLTDAATKADSSKDGRISFQEISGAVKSLPAEGRAAAIATWREAYDAQKKSPAVKRVLDRFEANAAALRKADGDKSGVLSRPELQVVTSAAAALGDYLQVIEKPTVLSDLDARGYLTQALKTSVGANLVPKLISVSGTHKKPVLEFRASNGAAKATLAIDPDSKKWIIGNLIWKARPTVVDPELASSFAQQLKKDFGLRSPKIFAAAPMRSTDEVSRYQLWVQHGSPRRTEHIQLEFTATDKNLASYHFELAAFKTQAIQLATQLSLDFTKNFESPRNRVGELEVFLNRDRVRVSQVKKQPLEDNPVGFDPKTEVQVMVPAMLGDLAVFVTVNKETGAMRANAVN